MYIHIHTPPILPPQKGLEFPGGCGWGDLEDQKIQRKLMCEAFLEFPEGWGGVRKESLPWGRHGYFLELHIVFSVPTGYLLPVHVMPSET